MHLSILISRSLQDDSVILSFQKDHNVDIDARSLLDFQAVDFKRPKTSWLFFYSKTAVKYFEDKSTINSYNVGCYGLATSHYARQHGNVSFHCNSDPSMAKTMITQYVPFNDLTFVIGRQSLRSVQNQLPNGDHYPEVIVYDQHIRSPIDLDSYNIAILTSPLNVKSFFLNGGSADHFIAIGHTTAKALANYNVQPHIAESPSEEGISKTLLSLIKN